MTHRAAEGPSLSHATLLRLLRLRAEGASLVALAKEVGVTTGTLRKRMKAVAAITGRGFAAQPETKLPAKAHRSLSVPMKRRGVPAGPVEPEPSKPALRAMLAEAVRNTPHH